jgi:Domain of unknown function (DUF4386)
MAGATLTGRPAVPAADDPRAGGTTAEAHDTDRMWKTLYRIGGWAALIGAALIPVAMVVFILWPPPAAETPVVEWFARFQDNPVRGLLNLDLVYMGSWLALIPVLLALYPALRRFGEAAMALGTAGGLMSVVVYFASNTAVQMLLLSNGYAAATTDAERAGYLAAGQAMLATYAGTAYHVSLILGSVALILVSVVMLRSGRFGRVAAWAGIVGNGLALGLYLPVVGLGLLIASVLPLFFWQVLVGRRLLELGRSASPEVRGSGS